jgi:hypothetical protein
VTQSWEPRLSLLIFDTDMRLKINEDATLYYVPRIFHIPHDLVKQDRMFASLKLDLGVGQRLY